MAAAALGFRRKNRTRSERRWLRLPRLPLARLGSLLAAVSVPLAVAAVAALALNRPVRTVTVDGAFQRVPALEVEKAVRGRLQGGFVTANLDAVRQAVEALPWVDRARVQRRWPDGLIVQVTEQEAAARWGVSALMNTRGEVFTVDVRHLPEELPRLAGPPGSEREVADLYFRLYPRLVEAGLRAAALSESERGAWQLELTDGVEVRFGRRQLAERVERFLKFAAPVIASRPNDIAAIDLRYSNGFSVVWRTQAGAPNSSPAGSPGAAKEHDPDG